MHLTKRPPLRNVFCSLIVFCTLTVASGSAVADSRPADSIPSADLIQPAARAAILRGEAAPKPVILHVGFRTLYEQAHIPAAEYTGPASEGQGLKRLRGLAAKLSKDADIVVYCGCCPWDNCPNIADAYFALHDLGFTHVRVLYVPNNFGHDWVEKGYPVVKGS
jgi:thiosulfate/3-mercaptopyruvate sulfurtransferase